jgi:hypothetical protein
MSSNNEWKKVTASIVGAVVFTILCLVSFTEIDGMRGGYALAFISFFLAVSSGAVSLLFVHRARIMDAIIEDPDPLAHWIYPEEIARAAVQQEYHDYRERNRAMFIVIGGLLVIVALFFLIFVGNGGLETGLFLLIFTAFLFGVSRVTPWLEQRRALSTPHESVITRDGIIYEGSVFPFHTFFVYWHGVRPRKPVKTHPAALVFSFTRRIGLFIVQPFDVIVPVPSGEEEKAVRIVQQLDGDVSER